MLLASCVETNLRGGAANGRYGQVQNQACICEDMYVASACRVEV